jgi:hypothetical protein
MQQALDALDSDNPDIQLRIAVALRTRLAQPEPEKKLWLWKNFVDGRPEYWAFDNPYPTNLDNGDPQTLGQPCGYAIFKPSRDGSNGRTEEQVLREMKSVTALRARLAQPELEELARLEEAMIEAWKPIPQREWQGLTDEEIKGLVHLIDWTAGWTFGYFAKAIEAKLKEKNSGEA